MTTAQFAQKFEINQNLLTLIQESNIEALTEFAAGVFSNPESQEDVNSASIVVRLLIFQKQMEAVEKIKAAGNREKLTGFDMNPNKAVVRLQAIQNFLIKNI